MKAKGLSANRCTECGKMKLSIQRAISGGCVCGVNCKIIKHAVIPLTTQSKPISEETRLIQERINEREKVKSLKQSIISRKNKKERQYYKEKRLRDLKLSKFSKSNVVKSNIAKSNVVNSHKVKQLNASSNHFDDNESNCSDESELLREHYDVCQRERLEEEADVYDPYDYSNYFDRSDNPYYDLQYEYMVFGDLSGDDDLDSTIVEKLIRDFLTNHCQFYSLLYLANLSLTITSHNIPNTINVLQNTDLCRYMMGFISNHDVISSLVKFLEYVDGHLTCKPCMRVLVQVVNESGDFFDIVSNESFVLLLNKQNLYKVSLVLNDFVRKIKKLNNV